MNDNKKVLSVSSPRKNISMVVYHNTDAWGRKSSITRFEKTNPDKPCMNRFNSGKGVK